MLENAFKEKVKRGEFALGSFVNFYAPALVEIIGYSGLDFIVIDDEHGAFSYPQIEELIRSAEVAGITPFVRVSYDNSAIQKALDRGAKGVQVPMVNNKADAEAVVKKAKYPPMGSRGTAYSHRAARFGSYSGNAYLEAADQNTFIIVHIETPEAVANFTDIVSVPGIDAVFVGPTDLSVSMGYKVEGPSHPAVQSVIQDLFRKGRETGTIMGTVAGNPVDIGKCITEGLNFATVVASGVISSRYKELEAARKKFIGA